MSKGARGDRERERERERKGRWGEREGEREGEKERERDRGRGGEKGERGEREVRMQEGDLFGCIWSYFPPPHPPSIPYCDGEWGSMSSSYILYQRESTLVRRERKRSSVLHVVFLPCYI